MVILGTFQNSILTFPPWENIFIHHPIYSPSTTMLWPEIDARICLRAPWVRNTSNVPDYSACFPATTRAPECTYSLDYMRCWHIHIFLSFASSMEASLTATGPKSPSPHGHISLSCSVPSLWAPLLSLFPNLLSPPVRGRAWSHTLVAIYHCLTSETSSRFSRTLWCKYSWPPLLHLPPTWSLLHCF